MKTLDEDPALAEWWTAQPREYLDDSLVRAKDANGRRILGTIQATPMSAGVLFRYGVRPGVTPEEEYRLACECYDRSFDLLVNGVQYQWQQTDGVLWVQLMDGVPFGF